MWSVLAERYGLPTEKWPAHALDPHGDAVAKLLDAAEGSILNWEHGKDWSFLVSPLCATGALLGIFIVVVTLTPVCL